MSLQFLLDLLTGEFVLVDVNVAAVVDGVYLSETGDYLTTESGDYLATE